MEKVFSVAIDGPAGAGKSTIAKRVAERYGALYLDTGAMYRAMGLYMRDHGLDTVESIAAAVEKPVVSVQFVDGRQRMFLDGADVTEEIRTPEGSRWASKVSAVPAVRVRMVELQREIAGGNSVVMDGRDIGTHVLPDATLKIYLTAACEVRARRRYDEMIGKGQQADYEQVLHDIIQRDYDDTHRAASPLRQAEDAVRLDTSDMDLDQVVAAISEMVEKAIGG